MKQVWKRTLSLALSAVLLMGSVPMGALATEETTVPTETTVVETQPTVAETQPTMIDFTATTNVANEETTMAAVHPVWINGKQLTADVCSGNLGSGSYAYDSKEKTLTLTDVALVADTENAVKATESLTIVLNGTNTLTSVAENKSAILVTGGSLTIKGVGMLETVSEKSNAIYVSPAAQDSDDKYTLTISGDVTVLAKAEDNEHSLGIYCPGGIVIGEGKTHLKINTTNSSTSNDSGDVYTLPSGYVKIGTDADSKFDTAPTTWTANGGSFEFIAESHLEYVKVDDDFHALSCKKVNEKECTLNVSGIASEAHTESTAAGCEKAAYCGACKAYYGLANPAHSQEPEWVPTEDKQQHYQKYSCCNNTLAAEDHDFSYQWEDEASVITQLCGKCQFSKDFFRIMVPTVAEGQQLTWDGNAKTVSVSPEGVAYTIAYKREIKGDGENEVGHEDVSEAILPGNYIAVAEVTLGEGENQRNFAPQVKFTIGKKPLTSDMIGKIGNDKGEIEYVPTSPARSEPTFTVTDSEILVEGQPKTLEKGKDFIVKYYRGENGDQPTEDFTKPGKITVEIEAIDGENGCQYYTGKANTTYTITKADVPDDAFTPNFPEEGKNPEYDGQKKSLSCKPKSGLNPENMEPAAEFYETFDSETPVDAINAGTYFVKIRVPENDYFNERIFANADWKLVIDEADVGAAELATEAQTIRIGDNNFETPKVLGVERNGVKEEVEGTFVYTYGEKTYSSANTSDMSALNTELKKQENKEVEVGYTFTPSNDNYKGTKTGKIKVKVVKISFEVDGKSVPSQERAYTVKTSPQPVYLDADIVTLKTITAKAGDSSTTSGFSVLFQKAGGEEKAVPDAGTNSFKVYFSGELDGVPYDKIVVDSGSVEIARKTPAITVTAAADLTDQDAGDPLVTVTSNGEKIKYSLDGGTTWSYNVPVVPAEHGSGVYKVKYEVEQTTNFTAKSGYEDVKVVVKPYLTAAYGTTLAQVEEQIECASGTWAFEEPKDTTKVGDVNTAGNPHNMSFTPKGATQATETGCPVKIFVSAVHITLDFDVTKTHHAYNSGNEIKAAVTVKEKTNSTAREATLLDPLPSSEYELTYSNNKNPGKATVTIASKGNYIFDNPAAELTKEFVIYRLGILELKDDATAVPPELKDDTGTKYATGADIKDALDEKYDETAYPQNRRTYVKYLMMNEGTAARYDEFYWPDGGSGTLEWEYDNIVTKDDNFKIYGMYMVTSERLGTEAGEIFEMKEITSGSPGVNEFYIGTDGIQFKLKNYAVLCFAAEADPDVEYTITKAVSPSSSYGTVSVQADGTAVSKAKYGTKLTVTASPKSGYSLTSVTVTDANSKSVTTTKVSEGNYELTMPASNIKVTAKFATTTSSSKNPSSGDTSNIFLWLTILAASAVGIAALVIFWVIKRRK